MARAAATRAQPTGKPDVWLASGVRTPFAKAGGALARKDALDLSVPVVKAMLAKARPDLINWGAVIPNLTISNLARVGAPTRVAMTVGFVVFGLGLIILQETWHITLFRAIEAKCSDQSPRWWLRSGANVRGRCFWKT